MPADPVPGPWRWDYDRDTVNLVSDDGTTLVLQIYESHGGGERPSDSDARLIAAAPYLLETLKALLADIQDYQRINHLGGEDNLSQVNARAAIAKAEGR